MSSTIRDMLYVNHLEDKFDRELTESEMNGELFYVETPDGLDDDWYEIPILKLPDDLTSITTVSELSTLVADGAVSLEGDMYDERNLGDGCRWVSYQGRFEHEEDQG